jgi:hypothetical protein
VDLMLNTLLGAVAAIAILVGPFLVFARAAMHFGADSRPTIDDRDVRPWLWRGRFD